MKRATVSYEIFENHAYGVNDTSVRGGIAALNFTPQLNGYVLIGTLTFDIRDGYAIADLRALDDGEHKVTVYSSGTLIPADSITKSGNIIALTPPAPRTVRTITKELIGIKRELAAFKAELSAMRGKIDGASVL